VKKKFLTWFDKKPEFIKYPAASSGVLVGDSIFLRPKGRGIKPKASQ